MTHPHGGATAFREQSVPHATDNRRFPPGGVGCTQSVSRVGSGVSPPQPGRIRVSSFPAKTAVTHRAHPVLRLHLYMGAKNRAAVTQRGSMQNSQTSIRGISPARACRQGERAWLWPFRLGQKNKQASWPFPFGLKDTVWKLS